MKGQSTVRQKLGELQSRTHFEGMTEAIHVLQGFLMIPYRLFSPTFFPLFTILRKLRILPCECPSPVQICSEHGTAQYKSLICSVQEA